MMVCLQQQLFLHVFAKFDFLKEFAKFDLAKDEFAKYDVLLYVAFGPGECGKTPPHAGGGEQR